jgi:hypothetical protein
VGEDQFLDRDGAAGFGAFVALTAARFSISVDGVELGRFAELVTEPGPGAAPGPQRQRIWITLAMLGRPAAFSANSM